MNQPCMTGINPVWSWCIVLFIYCLIWFTSILLRVFYSYFHSFFFFLTLKKEESLFSLGHTQQRLLTNFSPWTVVCQSISFTICILDLQNILILLPSPIQSKGSIILVILPLLTYIPCYIMFYMLKYVRLFYAINIRLELCTYL